MNIKYLFLLFFSSMLFYFVNTKAQNYSFKTYEEKNDILKLKLSKDAKYFAILVEKVKYSDKTILKIVDFNTLKVAITIEGDIIAFDISPDSKYLLSKTHKGVCQLWEISTGKNVDQWKSDAYYSDLFFSNDGCFYVEIYDNWIGINGPLKVFELSSHREFFQFNPEYIGISNAHYSDDGAKLYCGSGGYIFIIKSENGELLTMLPLDNKSWYHGKLDCALRYNSYLDKIFSSNRQDTYINIINPVSGDIDKTISTDDYRIDEHYSFSPDERYVAYSLNKIIYLLDLESDVSIPVFNVNKKLSEFKISSNFAYGIGYSNNLLYIVDLSNFNINSKLFYKNFNILLNDLKDVYKTITLRDEFETIDQYYNRMISVNQALYDKKVTYLNLILTRKDSIQKIETEKTEILDYKINESIRDTILSIESVGKYDIDYQLLPVTIINITKVLKIIPEDAKNLKENFKNVIVKAKKRLSQNLKNWAIYNIIIVLPESNKEIPFID